MFNADEVFEIAEQIERNGAAFYRKAAGEARDPKTSQLLLAFAQMEDEHLEVFESLRQSLSRREWKPVLDPDGQTALYLRAIADGHIFDATVDPADALTGDEAPREILRKAVELEKDSVIFYEELKQTVPQGLGRERLDRIIGEEFRHITILNAHLKAL